MIRAGAASPPLVRNNCRSGGRSPGEADDPERGVTVAARPRSWRGRPPPPSPSPPLCPRAPFRHPHTPTLHPLHQSVCAAFRLRSIKGGGPLSGVYGVGGRGAPAGGGAVRAGRGDPTRPYGAAGRSLPFGHILRPSPPQPHSPLLVRPTPCSLRSIGGLPPPQPLRRGGVHFAPPAERKLLVCLMICTMPPAAFCTMNAPNGPNTACATLPKTTVAQTAQPAGSVACLPSSMSNFSPRKCGWPRAAPALWPEQPPAKDDSPPPPSR